MPRAEPEPADVSSSVSLSRRSPEGPSTADLLDQVRQGNAGALETLFSRVLPPLRRWARGQLPAGARGLLDTEDLVQDTAVKVLPRLRGFESRGRGALLGYMREAVLNRIRDEIARRRPISVTIDYEHAATDPSPLEEAIGREAAESYERALQRLTPLQRAAVIARIELGQSYEEIAAALNRPSANAARSLIVRALYRLHQELICGKK